jgi:hypothetical protein
VSNIARLKELELFVRKAAQFKNVTTNGEWVNFSCLLAKHSQEHRFLDDRSPSAGITIGKDGIVYYKCFTCKHQGPFINTIERYETKSKIQLSALRGLVEESQELPDYEYLSEVNSTVVKAEPLPFTNIFEEIEDYPEAVKYLLSRNISLQTAHNLGLQYDPDSKRITFPVRDSKGLTYGYTGRTIDPESKVKIKDYHFQKSHFILGTELWKADQPTILVEGLFAYAHLHEISKGKYFPFNIGAIMGSNISEQQVEILIKFGNPIYCLLDGDAPGIAGTKGKKGLVHYTKNDLPTFILNYPKYELEVYGLKIPVQKFDPDSLTLDEVWSMIQKPRLVL